MGERLKYSFLALFYLSEHCEYSELGFTEILSLGNARIRDKLSPHSEQYVNTFPFHRALGLRSDLNSIK